MEKSDFSVRIYETDAVIALLLGLLLRNHGLQTNMHGSLEELIARLQEECGEEGKENEGRTLVVVGDPASCYEKQETICELPKRFPSCSFILLSTHPDAAELGDGFGGVMQKPFLFEELLALLKEVSLGADNSADPFYPFLT